MAEHAPYRLPHTVVPRRYELEIAPDLAAAVFTGRASVNIQVVDGVSEFILNAVNLTLEDVVLRSAGARALSGRISYREADEQVVLSWPEMVKPGLYTLSLRFDGRLSSDLRGFYRTTVTEPGKTPVTIASTQCEATDARRVFPCWDEPDFKAVFAVTLVIDPALTGLSNAREAASELDGAGRRRLTFADTMPMSTYLVALVVGPFELTPPVMMDQVPVRIAARAAFRHLTDFAEETAVDTLRFFQNYFGIPCPADKMDHVAIPEFAAGAMENLGCVTYREEALLIDRDRASQMELLQVAGVIAHETAHMWFGDLVTMRWWNGLWLNEAFATFMQILASDALHPEWDVWTSFGSGRAYALAVDGLASTRPIEYPVGPPSESWGMFDVLTYEKGAAVLRMMEQYLGPEIFRNGIREYLQRHRYGNTETGDLWDALEASSGQPVREVMDSWVLQGGYPLVRAEWNIQRHEIELSQRPFRYKGEGSGNWQVPIVLGVRRNGGTSESVHVMLGQQPLRISVPADTAWVTANQGSWGFYRVAYSQTLWGRLVESLGEMTALERLGLAEDVWAAVLAGEAPLAMAVALWRTFVTERDPDVWSAVSRQLAVIDKVADPQGQIALQALIQEIGRPVFDAVGWEAVPGEDGRQGRLRAILVRLLGMAGADHKVRREAGERFAAHVSHGAAIAPDLLTAVVSVVASTGALAEWDMIYHEFKTASTPQDEKRYLYALADFVTPDLVARTLELYRSDEVRIQDGTYVLGRCLANRHAAVETWAMIERDWNEILEKYPQFMMPALIEPVATIVEEALADRTASWLQGHPMEDVARQVAQTLEFQAIHRGFAHRVAGDLSSVLGGAS